MCKIEFDYNQICCGCSSVIAYNIVVISFNR